MSDPTIIPFLRYADRPPSEEVWSVFERLLRNPPSAVVVQGIDYVVFNWNLYPAHPIADKYLRFFLAHPEKLSFRTVTMLKKLDKLSPQVKKQIVLSQVAAVENSELVSSAKNASLVLREVAYSFRDGNSKDKETVGVVRKSIESVLRRREKLDDHDLVSLHAGALSLNPDHVVPQSDQPVFRRLILDQSPQVRGDAMFVVEKAMAHELKFASFDDPRMKRYHRTTMAEEADLIAESRMPEAVSLATKFRSHSGTILFRFADLHSIPGFTDEAIELLLETDLNKLKRRLGDEGFEPLLRPKTLAAFEKLADAVESSKRIDLKDLFLKIAPDSVETALKGSGEWSPAFEQRIQARISRLRPAEAVPTAVAQMGKGLDSLAPATSRASDSAGVTMCPDFWAKLKKHRRM